MRPEIYARLAICCAALLIALMTAPAMAHELVPGVSGFAGQMLHPILITEQLILLGAMALVAGRMKGMFVQAALAFVAGIAVGKAAHLAIPWLPLFWYVPLALVLLAGLAVASLPGISVRLGAGLIFLLAGALSIDIIPDQPEPASLGVAVAATLASGLLFLLLVGLPLQKVESRWGKVVIRVAGAWLAAIALLNLALVWKSLTPTIG
ncbi:MAG: HupE/UreJ family protein [Rhizobiaceae bacterium]